MEEFLIRFLFKFEEVAIIVSILANIMLSLLGVVPSVFLTAANITVFGFVEGTIISLLGEVLGTFVSFILYRKGFKRISESKFAEQPKLKGLLHAEGRESFLLILALRIMPFVPSGVVTFIAAIGKTSIFIFMTASTLGKIPALLMEAFSVNAVIQSSWTVKMIFGLVAIILFIMFFQKKKK